MRVRPGFPRLTSQGRRWLAAEKRWPSGRAEGWVRRFVDRVLSAPETVAVVLVGSLARPAHDPNDVDLLYISEGEPVPLADRPADVEVYTYRADQFFERLAKREDVLTWALRFGRVVCQRGLFWSELVSSYGGDLPLPSPEAAEERARRAVADDVALLTERAWAQLLRKDVHPASRPELPQQLLIVDEHSLAQELASALRARVA